MVRLWSVYTGGNDGVFGEIGILRAWEAATGKLVAATDPKAHPDAVSNSVNAFGLSLCGKYAVYGGGAMWLPTEFVVARTSDLMPLRRVPGHTCAVGGFIPQEKGFISGSADQTVRLWDWESTTCHGTIKVRGVVRGLACSRDGSTSRSRAGRSFTGTVRPPVGAPEPAPRTQQDRGLSRAHEARGLHRVLARRHPVRVPPRTMARCACGTWRPGPNCVRSTRNSARSTGSVRPGRTDARVLQSEGTCRPARYGQLIPDTDKRHRRALAPGRRRFATSCPSKLRLQLELELVRHLRLHVRGQLGFLVVRE